MGGSNGRSKAVDGTTWLKAFQKGIAWGGPHQWRLDELDILRVQLRTFFEDVEKNQMPRKKLKRIENERKNLARDLYSPGLIKQMEHELDSHEIQMYQYLLGAEHYSEVTQTLTLGTSAADWKTDRIKEFLWKLREARFTLPDKEKRLRTPIGKKLSAGSKKSDGLSWKSAAIVGAYIFSVYNLFKQFYEVTGRGWNKKKSKKAEKGNYPFPLIRDITTFFSKEFSPWFDNLNDEDIISRIQYGPSRKVQRSMYFPNKLNID